MSGRVRVESVASIKMRNVRLAAAVFAAGVLLSFAAATARAQKAPTTSPDADCLACHSQPDLKSEKGRSVFVDPAKHQQSVHADVGCTACHTDIKEFPHPRKVARVKCGECHDEAPRDLGKGIHSALGPDVYSMDRAWLSGKAPADHLRHTRPAYHAELRKQEEQRKKAKEEAVPKEPPAPPATSADD
jgi:protein-arginine kinase activator protein McsA